jgi:hypothetical protein
MLVLHVSTRMWHESQAKPTCVRLASNSALFEWSLRIAGKEERQQPEQSGRVPKGPKDETKAPAGNSGDPGDLLSICPTVRVSRLILATAKITQHFWLQIVEENCGSVKVSPTQLIKV